MTPFAALHHRPGEPLLLPNAWDHASAAALAGQGFAAIGTTSLGVAAAAGLPDGVAATRRETLRLARRLGRGRFLLSVDVESGFSDDPSEVADLAVELAGLGAVGINLEDGRGDGTLAPVAVHAAKIAAVKAAAPDLFVNARTDTHWLGTADPGPETDRRLAAYQQAGADGVFVPGLADPAAIEALAGRLAVPLNILHSPAGPPLGRLADLGVARVSLGSLLYRAALAAAVQTAVAVREGGAGPMAGAVPAYGEVAGLHRDGGQG
ncbi:isocitrate lyase/phosphoenolpyruvate mutase family protein [Streptomyces sp. CB01881]|uniref:isocitrate lyase/PEP mutase family protein n=1 Tax=Streptomyces sp. CB01881 TaxID=2078691 RepID=UPI000CDC7F59|nr:isocitrate lyase/phosphoenolpyruvate mutase family protein [Streptomyces sp. CB01881]AUY50930.1 isocitrate lyase/phosphoenolpyruvate mutase family protein [Streptomyces sp. CB01881]TYC74313.1 isocitrate lyase/phosphoenolpyruvate mutase family protein [Streptomyces sp. CB01881]